MYSPLFVTLMGIGTVFFGLICIIVLTTIMGSVLKSNAKPAAPAPAAAPKPAAPKAPPVDNPYHRFFTHNRSLEELARPNINEKQ